VLLRELLSGQPPTEAGDSAARALPADLRAIIDKATADQSAARYSGVNEMLADLRRYGAGEPVYARAPTNIYRARCFLRRHRTGATIAGAMIVALITALLVTSRLYSRADAARLKADNRYTEVRQLSNYMLGDLQLRLASLPQSLPVRKEIVARGERYMHSLAVDETAPLDVKLDAIAGLTQLAEMQGVPGQPNVGDIVSARQSLQRALQIAQRLRSDGVAPMQVALATARIGIDLAATLVVRENDAKTAQQWLTSSRRNLDAAMTFDQRNAEAERLDIEWTLRSADVANWGGDYEAGARLAQLAIDKLAAMNVTGTQARNQAITLARAWDSLAEAIYYRGDYSDSVIPYQREIAIVDQAGKQFPGDTLVERNRMRAYWSLGTTYLQIKRNTEALQALATSTDIGRELMRQEPNDADVLRDAAVAYAAYGEALAGVAQYALAIEILTATVQQRAYLAREHPEAAANLRDYAISLAALADVHLQSGDVARACQLYPEARAVHDRLRREGRSVALSENYAVKHLDGAERRSCRKSGGDSQ
jgi:tetratricopeptide (TPR) repeat protein